MIVLDIAASIFLMLGISLESASNASLLAWSEKIADIDKQLYKKYGLSDEGIEFIETHVI